jgi:hypothetical protein
VATGDEAGFAGEIALDVKNHVKWYPLRAHRYVFIILKEMESDSIILHFF